MAIALVAAAGLGLGRHVIGWWNAEPDAAVVPAAADLAAHPWDAHGTPLKLEFGDAPSAIERTSVVGTREQAVETLADACAALAASAELPTGPMPPAEERLLEAASRLAPVREQPGRWRVHVLDGPVIIAAGVGEANNADAPSGDATPARRVLCWGLAFPAGENVWTLYTFRPAGDAGASPLAARIAERLPPGSRRVLSVQSATGGALIVFEGAGRLSEWSRAIEAGLEAAGLGATDGWQPIGSGASARFGAHDRDGRTTIDVHVFHSTAGQLTGVISIARRDKSSE